MKALERISTKVWAGFATMAVLLCLATPASADLRAGASQDAYGGQGALVTGQGTPVPPVAAAASEDTGLTPADTAVAPRDTAVAPANVVLESGDSAALPFTGLDLLALVGGGLVLVLVGMTVRQVARRPA